MSLIRKMILSILVIAPLKSFSQSLVKGTVFGEFDNKVEYANIIVKDSTNSKYITGAVTDSVGFYQLSLAKGVYFVVVSSIGFKKAERRVVVSEILITQDWRLYATNNSLATVTIVSRKPLIQRKVDRVIFDVQNSITAQGGDAMDALRISPSVKVLNDQIGIIGRSGVQVMINNRLIHLSGEELINYLKSIKADNIAQIEVITNPPADYDADGNSGLINIVLKKAKQNNFNGSINTTYVQSTYPGANLSANINYNKDKFTLTTSLALRDIATLPILTNDVFYPLQNWSSTSHRKDVRKNISGTIGLQYEMSKKTLLAVQYIGESSSWHIKDNSRTLVSDNSTANIDSTINTNSTTKINNHSYTLNLHLQSKLDTTGKLFSLDADYFSFITKNNFTFQSSTQNANSIIENSSNLSSSNLSNQYIKIYTLKTDFTIPSKLADFQLGGKLSFINNTSTISETETYDLNQVDAFSQNDIFNYKENTQSIYGSAKKSFFKQLELKVGLRLETTQTDGHSISTDVDNKSNYVKLFPTVYLTNKLNTNNLFAITYGRRIGRPSYGSLNPFRYYSNPYSFSEGNPFLQPSFTDNFEVSHIYKNDLSSIIYFSKTKGGFGQVTILNSNTNIQQTIVSNYFNSEKLGISENYTFTQIPGWESYNELNLYYNKINAVQIGVLPKLNGVSAYFSSNNSFALNSKKSLRVAVNYYFQLPDFDALYKYGSYSQLNLGLKATINNKFEIALNAIDILKTSKQYSYSYSNGIKYEFNNYFDVRSLRLSVTFKFGKTTNKLTNNNIGNEDERKRTH